ncbi:MAG TPA: decarboxylating NADP(+)-dependent phosphogluconate dehydrogenase [bacterium]|uniref:6-phosphogluconate dehydrogenase, decarboxylating n=1 Tax=candidate division TA06 bacterium ADurb.Bin417 TaxID=1852828 RepID=A0A1V5MG16_UNCT6|nr:MAG: 6-phosphogluconate dehydrogenase, NADP(+)-dependent, decarboxylating [candidate division TA06 bacterium ADurb.Bin417]HNS49227.1 decarboxylating NADP(+)-dependent phosphogluconate dehydrogenase [bacterium]
MEKKADIGLIGLAVMGENLVLNMESRGFTVAVFNRTVEKVDAFVAGRAKGRKIIGCHSVEELASQLKSPRKVMLMVKAGEAVDNFIDLVKSHLSAGDIIIDGGNSLFTDTIRRTRKLESEGFRYIGTGVSGGEEGALHGPAIMPGGSASAWPEVQAIFEKIAAKAPADGKPCCTWIGPDGAGHHVKMVHNGIEYGDMELIVEAYYIMRYVLGIPAAEQSEIFKKWNQDVLSSYLIEITGDILGRVDPDTGRPLVEVILDKAGQKGTGKWTSQNALDLGVPAPTIAEAVFARCMSALKDERVKAAAILPGPKAKFTGDKAAYVEAIHAALYCSKICSYAQGFGLMREAAREYKWNLDFGKISLIWRAGCIIRAQFLQKIADAYGRNPELANLLLDEYFQKSIAERQEAWRQVVSDAARLGIPAPAFASALAYYDGYRSEVLPANLIQAQRDYFGAHTYERVDRPGTYHTNWVEEK